MNSFERLAGTTVSALAAFALVGCEQHPPSIAKDAPAHLHVALTGDIADQAFVADCYAANAGCLGQKPDPPLGCAWRGVRLASRSPDLSLLDTDAFRTACAGLDDTGRQRAAIALDDLSRRIYGRPGMPLPAIAEAAPAGVLYPSMAKVYGRVNRELDREHAARLGPLNGTQADGPNGATRWAACSPAICLRGQSPAYGGGLTYYRVEAKAGAPSGLNSARSLAGRLAGAGLEAPNTAGVLIANGAAKAVTTTTVCWTAGGDARGGAFVQAAAAPCAAP